ncbi:hypothetical protein T484DRAFT_2634832 [Baffinella frigidus]|nr:hypothetical protein T484DRAFT_2634832 [Cryptophyta sp. CCMP2293]
MRRVSVTLSVGTPLCLYGLPTVGSLVLSLMDDTSTQPQWVCMAAVLAAVLMFVHGGVHTWRPC